MILQQTIFHAPELCSCWIRSYGIILIDCGYSDSLSTGVLGQLSIHLCGVLAYTILDLSALIFDFYSDGKSKLRLRAVPFWPAPALIPFSHSFFLHSTLPRCIGRIHTFCERTAGHPCGLASENGAAPDGCHANYSISFVYSCHPRRIFTMPLKSREVLSLSMFEEHLKNHYEKPKNKWNWL
jgi:hypothetical protein